MKSVPSFTSLAQVTVARSIVPPILMTAEPSACFASLPVSISITLPSDNSIFLLMMFISVSMTCLPQWKCVFFYFLHISSPCSAAGRLLCRNGMLYSHATPLRADWLASLAGAVLFCEGCALACEVSRPTRFYYVTLTLNPSPRGRDLPSPSGLQGSRSPCGRIGSCPLRVLCSCEVISYKC